MTQITAAEAPLGAVKAVAPRLTANQWKVLCVCAIAGMLETMDIYIIGFVLAVITGPWKLSYGVSATILLASGAGAILGSLAWGHIADTIGRKKAFLATIITCSGCRSSEAPRASSTSAEPLLDDTPRLPCLATFAPAAAATNIAVVEMLKLCAPSPPVPTISRK